MFYKVSWISSWLISWEPLDKKLTCGLKNTVFQISLSELTLFPTGSLLYCLLLSVLMPFKYFSARCSFSILCIICHLYLGFGLNKVLISMSFIQCLQMPLTIACDMIVVFFNACIPSPSICPSASTFYFVSATTFTMT